LSARAYGLSFLAQPVRAKSRRTRARAPVAASRAYGEQCGPLRRSITSRASSAGAPALGSLSPLDGSRIPPRPLVATDVLARAGRNGCGLFSPTTQSSNALKPSAARAGTGFGRTKTSYEVVAPPTITLERQRSSERSSDQARLEAALAACGLLKLSSRRFLDPESGLQQRNCARRQQRLRASGFGGQQSTTSRSTGARLTSSPSSPGEMFRPSRA
jgi:hypothetical protein